MEESPSDGYGDGQTHDTVQMNLITVYQSHHLVTQRRKTPLETHGHMEAALGTVNNQRLREEGFVVSRGWANPGSLRGGDWLV